MSKKIAISFIGTGRYLNFLPGFYEGLSEKFAPECEKHFFVFTDGELDDLPDDVTLIPISEDTPITQEYYSVSNWYKLMNSSYGGLKRFSALKQIKEQLKEYDWYCFVDSDIVCSDKVIPYADFFNEDKDLFGAQHPCFHPGYVNNPNSLPHDRNPESLAFIPKEDDDGVYLQGCLWGGKVPQVFDIIDKLDDSIKEDVSKGILAPAHDESYLNRYRNENKDKFHVLHPSYIKPGDMPQNMFNYDGIMYHSPAYKRQILEG